MIGYDSAIALIRAAAPAGDIREVGLQAALRSTAARDICAPSPVPRFANAAMDGYAMRSCDTRNATAAAPVEFAVTGQIAAGQPQPAQPTAAMCAWEIMTGAPMPVDCDAVVPVERTQVCESSAGRPAIRIGETLTPGQNRRAAGEDFAPGDPILAAGDEVSAQAVMALAAAGFDSIAVRTPPRIALVTTGSELAPSGNPRTGSSIRDTNGPYISAMLDALGMHLAARHSVADDLDELSRALASLVKTSDVVLTTGGVSAGRFDVVPTTVGRIGAEIIFHKVAIRPGKPLLFARLASGQLLFGLPGNPMAVAVGLRFFVLPALRSLAGMPAECWLPARCVTPVRRHASMTFFAKARARISHAATLEVEILRGQESFRISPLLKANCWAVVPPGEHQVEPGDTLSVAPLLPATFPAL